MAKRFFQILLIISFCGGCTLLNGEQHRETLQAIQQSRSNLEQRITTLETEIQKRDDTVRQLDQKIEQLSSQIKSNHNRLKKALKRRPQIPPTPPKTIQPSPAKLPSEPVIFGALEQVSIEHLTSFFSARIDTGAETSSINALELKTFERDGKTWVTFMIQAEDDTDPETLRIEAPVLRHVRIRQSSSTEVERRPVVKLWIRLGTIHEQTEFTLADRSHMTHPVLLGREFIKDIALVDVSRNFIQTPRSTSKKIKP